MRRFLLLFVGSLIYACLATATVTLVQHPTNGCDIASTSSGTCSFSVNTTAGNIIIVALRVGGTATAAVTDDKSGGSNTYNSDVSLNHASFGTGYIFSAPNAGAAKVITITLTGGPTTIRAAIYEYSGIATTTPLDQTSSLYTAAGPAAIDSGTTATTTQASELLFGAEVNNTVEGASSPTAGTSQSFVLEDKVPADPSARLATEDVIVSVTGTYRADWHSIVTGTDHIALIATYKASGGSPPPPQKPPIIVNRMKGGKAYATNTTSNHIYILSTNIK